MKAAGELYSPPGSDPISALGPLNDSPRSDESTTQEQGNVSAKPYTGKIKTSKAELKQKAEKAFKEKQPELEKLERENPEAARMIRQEHAEQLQEIEERPEGPIEIDAPSVEVGEHSIRYATATYDANSAVKDPINLVFYHKGWAANVTYWVDYYGSKSWAKTSCYGDQWGYIYDSAHSGGYDGWSKNYAPNLKRVLPGYADDCTERYHVRLFDSLVYDSHGSFGWWSLAGAHWDDFRISNFEHCANWWEDAQTELRQTVKDSYGNPLYWVYQTWYADIGNAGYWGCDSNSGDRYNNGYATFVDIQY